MSIIQAELGLVMGRIHAASLSTSARLQHLNAFLSDGQPHSTRDIVTGAEIMAVNSAVTELRANGIKIETTYKNDRYFYRKVT